MRCLSVGSVCYSAIDLKEEKSWPDGDMKGESSSAMLDKGGQEDDQDHPLISRWQAQEYQKIIVADTKL